MTTILQITIILEVYIYSSETVNRLIESRLSSDTYQSIIMKA